MFICRLFHRDRPFEQMEARLIDQGETTVGRDADWSLPDPDGVLSRVHLVLAVEAGRLFVCDQSTNGTYLADGERIGRDQPRELFPRDSLRLGVLDLLVDAPVASNYDTSAALQATAPLSLASEWQDATPARLSAPAHRDISLIEAFCEGARLDASALSLEDPQDLMRRVGAIYQQTILGLATLMAERARLKSNYDLDRTTISAAANNPFKWTPTRKLAQDLLCGGDTGFLSDADAVRSSFEDLITHVNALAHGADTASSQAIQTLSPQAIEAEAKEQGSLLRSRHAVCWDILIKRYAAINEQRQSNCGAFTGAYQSVAAGNR
jgi:predicted component of type VI protein secretion system